MEIRVRQNKQSTKIERIPKLEFEKSWHFVTERGLHCPSPSNTNDRCHKFSRGNVQNTVAAPILKKSLTDKFDKAKFSWDIHHMCFM